KAGATLNFQDNFSLNGGTLTNAGNVTSVSSATLTLAGAGTLGGTGSTRLPFLTLSGAAQTTLLGGAITVQGTLSNGASHTVDVSGSNYAITVSSSWTNSGTF